MTMKLGNVLRIDDRKQLFVDDKFFDRQQGIRLVVNPPVKREIGLKSERPWESGCLGFYSTIIEDEGVYKLWYDAFVGLEVSKEVPRSICYATSTDGIYWKRENVNLYNWMGHPENNMVMPGVDGAVMIDPVAPPEHRYKALGCIFENSLWPESKGAHWDLTGGGVYLMTSPDGIRWKRVDHVASPFFHDSQNNLLYDDRIKKYVAYMRTHLRGRTVSRVEMDDPTKTSWSYRKPPGDVKPNQYGLYLCDNYGAYDLVMACDELDPPDTDIQTCPIVKYPWAENIYIGLCVPYRHYPENIPGTYRNDGPQDVQLAVSRDGIHWQRPDRKPYISLGLAGEWDGGCMWPCLGMIRKGGEIWQYYCASSCTHGDWDMTKLPMGGICRTVQRLDGFISADADYTGGEFTTPLLQFSGSTLQLNIDCSAMGSCRVEILDEQNSPISGFSQKEAVPVERNHLAFPAQWTSNTSMAVLQGRPVRLRFKLRACKLFAFQFVK